MTVINTNVGALQARTYAVRADGNVTKAMERLSSGLRINSAADDAAGLAVANKMESQIRGMNMAIRNSQDGISLVQTAESAMGEINNMVIRMRELAVQMNNGVYTDTDRANAQLEVTALLAEIDKVATNSAFNQVKILDGTYSQDIRAGNTNPEVINVTIDRMNTDSLGGGRVTRGVEAATAGTTTAKSFETTLTATEGRPTIALSALGLDAHASATGNSGGTYSIMAAASNSDHAKFTISNNEITLDSSLAGNTELNFVSGGGNSAAGTNAYSFKVSYTKDGVTVTDDVTLNITDKPVTTAGSTVDSSSTLTVEEAACVKIQASTVLSDQVNEFIGAASAGSLTYGLSAVTGGNAADLANGGFTINSGTGEILASLDFERPDDVGSDNSYEFMVTVTDGTTTMRETVTLNVTDFENAGNTADDAVFAATDAAAAGGVTPGNLVAQTMDLELTHNGNAADLAVADLTAALAAVTTFEGTHDDAEPNGWRVVSVDGTAVADAGTQTIATGVTLTNAGALAVDSSALTNANDTVENVHLRLTADNGRTFDVFTDITITDLAAAAVAPSLAATNVVTAGEHRTLSVEAGGEAAVLDLKVDEAAGADKFDGIAAFYAANPCGVFTVENATFNGAALAGANANALTVNNSGELTLEAGLAAGVYEADIYYEDNEGDSYVERVTITSTDIGIRGENTAGRAANATDQTASATAHHAATATQSSTEQVAGISTININEARQGTIQSIQKTVGGTTTSGILSSALDSFARTDYPGGSFTINGTDKELFTIDATTGDISTKGLVDYESKTSYSFSVTYTNGSNSYTEDVTLTVADDTVDNTTHIDNVNLGSQAGAATAVTILDTAINQISSSQAKLGAIQNRLQYNIDNLSKASMLTQTAKGRIMDADFASETSELSKQQILSQAATSMLAQANQSKQSVLALLQ
jgi:flagellin